MTESSECPECGNILPIDAPQGLCPRCLLNRGLENDETESVDAIAYFLSAAQSSHSNGLMVNHGRNLPDLACDNEPGCTPAHFFSFAASDLS